VCPRHRCRSSARREAYCCDRDDTELENSTEDDDENDVSSPRDTSIAGVDGRELSATKRSDIPISSWVSKLLQIVVVRSGEIMLVLCDDADADVVESYVDAHDEDKGITIVSMVEGLENLTLRRCRLPLEFEAMIRQGELLSSPRSSSQTGTTEISSTLGSGPNSASEEHEESFLRKAHGSLLLPRAIVNNILPSDSAAEHAPNNRIASIVGTVRVWKQ